MNQETAETQAPGFADSHPWLVQTADPEDETIDEAIRYTLDEIRFS